MNDLSLARLTIFLFASVAVVQAPNSAGALAGENGVIGQLRPPRGAPDILPGSRPARYAMAKRFLGGARGAYVFANWSVAENWRETALGGEVAERSGSSWLLWGFRAHSAQERGAMLLSGDGKAVQALGILHFDCYGVWRKRRPPVECMNSPVLSIFVRRAPGSSRYAAQVGAWADRQEGHHVPSKIVWVPPKRSR